MKLRIAWLATSLALSCVPVKPAPLTQAELEKGSTRCAADTDCTPSDMCRNCGKCYARHPQVRVDCEAECMERTTCTCVSGECTTVRTP